MGSYIETNHYYGIKDPDVAGTGGGSNFCNDKQLPVCEHRAPIGHTGSSGPTCWNQRSLLVDSVILVSVPCSGGQFSQWNKSLDTVFLVYTHLFRWSQSVDPIGPFQWSQSPPLPPVALVVSGIGPSGPSQLS